jgi:predicted ArsR family transcriptional regulator
MSVTSEVDASTREQVLHLVVSRGPISAGDLAAALDLTPPAVRRHIVALQGGGQIVARDTPASVQRGRGRPAKRYVATTSAHEHMSAAYAELAVQAMRHLTATAGQGAVRAFADARAADVERRYERAMSDAGPGVADRVDALAAALAEDGFETTTRPVPGTTTLQLCQGHCPVQHVAEAFPEFCEAETAAFSRLLGVHVQRLATLAGGGHVCTTSIQTNIPQAMVEGQR